KNKKVPVVGVINDINIQSLQHPVQPMIYRFGPYNNYPEYVTWRINPLRREETLAFFKEKWESHFPKVPFEPMWIEERFEMAYGEEEKLVSIVGLFAGMALILSMLGIAALSIIYTEKRIKEIGIRKVNGAKIPEILNLLNGEYIKWIALSFIMATPVIWYLVVRWLENFAYQTNISWWIFLLAGLLVVMVSIMIVSWKTLWAARRNPVEALRYE
ncbi:MAG: hypothetical protein MI922_03770, partial [Bacteroidales bacterium]|nr:hypothetical protein [Bacteroidales bacterium]